MRRFGYIIPYVVIGFFVYDRANDLYHASASSSDWMEVKSVYVLDTIVGRTPILKVSRNIKQDFHGIWTVTVKGINNDVEWNACTATNAYRYTTKSVLPSPVTLDWWTHPVKCSLPAGQYQITTEWMIDTNNKKKYIINVSNVFRVTEGTK